MNRRSFLKLVGLGAVGAAVAKKIVEIPNRRGMSVVKYDGIKPRTCASGASERYFMDEALTDDEYDAIMKKLAKRASDTMDAQIAHVFNLRY